MPLESKVTSWPLLMVTTTFAAALRSVTASRVSFPCEPVVEDDRSSNRRFIVPFGIGYAVHEECSRDTFNVFPCQVNVLVLLRHRLQGVQVREVFKILSGWVLLAIRYTQYLSFSVKDDRFTGSVIRPVSLADAFTRSLHTFVSRRYR